MLKPNESINGTQTSAIECKLHWSEWLLIAFAFLALGSMILHTVVSSGM
jgi:hypothetical protein